MKPTAKHATLKYPDGARIDLSLLKLRDKAFRWYLTDPMKVGDPAFVASVRLKRGYVADAQGNQWDDAEHASVPAALQHLRTWQEKHAPEVDLTFHGVADPPALRAAKAIDDWIWHQDGVSAEDMADIITRETVCDQVTEVLSELSSYIMWRLGAAVQADPAMTAILLKAVAAIEKATKDDLSNLRAKLSEPPSRIVRPS